MGEHFSRLNGGGSGSDVGHDGGLGGDGTMTGSGKKKKKKRRHR